jgi:hypothetical protein
MDNIAWLVSGLADGQRPPPLARQRSVYQDQPSA